MSGANNTPSAESDTIKAEPAPRNESRTSRRSTGTAALLAMALVVAALAVRLPYVQDIPRLTDETDEVGLALDILQGARPLVADDAYRGPFWAYLLAGVMRISGVKPEVPRLFAATLGALTAGAAFALAFELAPMGKKVAGLVAGAGTATATGLVTLGSHVAWSNNSTPLWVLLGAWTVVRAAATASARWWFAAGLAWAAALQSHPSAIAPLVGAAGWCVLAADRRDALRTRGAAVGAASFLALMSPMIVQNVREPMSTVAEVTADDVPVARDHSPRALAANVVGMTRQIGRFAGAGPVPVPIQTQILDRFGKDGPMGARTRPEYRRWLEGIVAAQRRQWIATWTYAAVLLASFSLCLVRNPRLVGAIAAASIVVLPVFNRSWENPYDARYVGFLVALGWVAIGTLVASQWTRKAPATRRGRFDDDATAEEGATSFFNRRLALAVAVAWLVAYPVTATFAWYGREIGADRTNVPYRTEAARLVGASVASGAPVLVDKGLRALELGGGGNGARTLEYLVRLGGATVYTTDESEIRWYLDQPDAKVIVVASRAAGQRLGGEWITGIDSVWAVRPVGVPIDLIDTSPVAPSSFPPPRSGSGDRTGTQPYP